MVSSVVFALCVPKILGPDSYAYWQLFVFYTGYAGLFLLGLNDGIYLVMGGTVREKMNKALIESLFKFSKIIQIAFALLIVIGAVVIPMELDRRLVIIATGVYIPLYNMAGYWGYVFQAMDETKLYSYALMLAKLASLVPLLFLLFFNIEDYLYYVIIMLLSQCVSLAFCFKKSRDFRVESPVDLKTALHNSLFFCKIGMSLMLANAAGMLILGVSRFVIDAVWGIQAFGQVSFALSLATFFIAFISQVGMVLFPALRQLDHATQRSAYEVMNKAFSLVLPIIYILFFPVSMFVDAWLPAYSSALVYLELIIPICVFEGKMQMLYATFLKVMRKEKILLAINCLAVLTSVLGSVVGANVFQSIEMVVASMVLGVAARGCISEWYIRKKIYYCPANYAAFDVLCAGIFVFCNKVLPAQQAVLVLGVLFVALLIFNRNFIRELYSRAK